jgi:hypothetical protein
MYDMIWYDMRRRRRTISYKVWYYYCFIHYSDERLSFPI